MDPVFKHPVVVSESAIDENGHVNNVEYLRWFIKSAIAHAGASGCTKNTYKSGATWFIREHRIA